MKRKLNRFKKIIKLWWCVRKLNTYMWKYSFCATPKKGSTKIQMYKAYLYFKKIGWFDLKRGKISVEKYLENMS